METSGLSIANFTNFRNDLTPISGISSRHLKIILVLIFFEIHFLSLGHHLRQVTWVSVFVTENSLWEYRLGFELTLCTFPNCS